MIPLVRISVVVCSPCEIWRPRHRFDHPQTTTVGQRASSNGRDVRNCSLLSLDSLHGFWISTITFLGPAPSYRVLAVVVAMRPSTAAGHLAQSLMLVVIRRRRRDRLHAPHPAQCQIKPHRWPLDCENPRALSQIIS